LLTECFARHVRWLPAPVVAELHSGRVSLRAWFEGAVTSLRLLLFQRHFLKEGADLATYHARFGQPTEAQQLRLLRCAKRTLGLSGWPAFFAALGLELSDAALEQKMRAAAQRSQDCGYHKIPRGCPRLRPARPEVPKGSPSPSSASTASGEGPAVAPGCVVWVPASAQAPRGRRGLVQEVDGERAKVSFWGKGGAVEWIAVAAVRVSSVRLFEDDLTRRCDALLRDFQSRRTGR